jgi:hypothetical protein
VHNVGNEEPCPMHPQLWRTVDLDGALSLELPVTCPSVLYLHVLCTHSSGEWSIWSLVSRVTSNVPFSSVPTCPHWLCICHSVDSTACFLQTDRQGWGFCFLTSQSSCNLFEQRPPQRWILNARILLCVKVCVCSACVWASVILTSVCSTVNLSFIILSERVIEIYQLSERKWERVRWHVSVWHSLKSVFLSSALPI